MRCALVSITSTSFLPARDSARVRCTIFSAEPRQWVTLTPYLRSNAAARTLPSCTVMVLYSTTGPSFFARSTSRASRSAPW